MKKIIFLLISISLLLVSCTKQNNTTDKTSTSKKDSVKKSDSINPHVETGEITEGLKLNNGKKWKADEATNKRVKNMQNMVKEFEQSENQDYPEACKKMQAEINLMLKECKMTGPDHDELHRWLEPILIEIPQFNSENVNDKKHACDRVKLQLKMYNDYFEQ
jgi:hypothetical protein